MAHPAFMIKRAKKGSPARSSPRQTNVSVVDDDESVRESLPDLLRELGFAAQAFASAEEFLESAYLSTTRCLLLDVSMPGMSGPALREELLARGYAIPVIFITARLDERSRTEVMARGPVECLFKPFGEEALKAALAGALDESPGKE